MTESSITLDEIDQWEQVASGPVKTGVHVSSSATLLSLCAAARRGIEADAYLGHKTAGQIVAAVTQRAEAAEADAQACREQIDDMLREIMATRAALAEAVRREREACAGYAENYDLGTPEGHDIARAIRARNDQRGPAAQQGKPARLLQDADGVNGSEQSGPRPTGES